MPRNILPVAICRKIPKGYNGNIYAKLCPSKGALALYRETQDEFAMKRHFYEETLSQLNAREIAEYLQSLNPEGDIVLICYEKPGDFCHRHLVSDWFNKSGITVKEY